MATGELSWCSEYHVSVDMPFNRNVVQYKCKAGTMVSTVVISLTSSDRIAWSTSAISLFFQLSGRLEYHNCVTEDWLEHHSNVTGFQ